MKKKLMIFDAYGTLISTGTGSLDAAKRILSLQEKDIDAKQFYDDWKYFHRLHCDEANQNIFVTEEEIFRMDLKKLYDKYGIQRDHMEDVKIMLESLYDRVAFSEVKETIDALRKSYRVVIGSTTDTMPLMSNLQSNNLCLDAVYTSEMIKKYKPDEGFYHYILERENCAVEDAVFIGDSLTDDVRGPQGVGIETVFVNRKAQGCKDVKPDFVISDLSELINIYGA